MTREALAKMAGVSERAIADFEGENRKPRQASLQALRLTLESAGVEFIAENGGGAGVRLARRGRA